MVKEFILLPVQQVNAYAGITGGGRCYPVQALKTVKAQRATLCAWNVTVLSIDLKKQITVHFSRKLREVVKNHDSLSLRC
jgi:hypothetical protein